MSDLKHRAVRTARRLGSYAGTNRAAANRARQCKLAEEYEFVLGLHLTPDEQLAQFKHSTEGAPVVKRVVRHPLTTG